MSGRESADRLEAEARAALGTAAGPRRPPAAEDRAPVIAQPLLVLDTAKIGTAGTILDLFSEELAEVGNVRLLDPILSRWPDGDLPPLRSRAEALTADAVPDANTVILAHCTNTALALEVANALTRRGAGPRGVLAFGPVSVTAETVREHVRELMLGLGADAASAGMFSSRTWPDGVADTHRALTGSLAVLHGAALEKARGLGLEGPGADQFADGLVERYDLWLRHLASSALAAVPAPDCPIHVVDESRALAYRTMDAISAGADVSVHEFTEPTAFSDSRLRRLLVDVLDTDSGFAPLPAPRSAGHAT